MSGAYRIACLLAAFLALLLTGASAGAARHADESAEQWRIRFLDAAIVQGDTVLLGEVAVPIGEMPPGKWQELAQRSLWPAPPKGKPVNMTRPRLQEAVMRTMRDLAPYCLFPGSMALQQGGVLVDKEAVQAMVESELRPMLAMLPGEGVLTDFRLPQHVFMQHSGQELVLDLAKKMTPGRNSLRLLVKEMDGSVVQKLTGSVFADCWAEVPCSTVTLNRDDLLDHGKVTFKRMNLANLRSDPWDGRGGPWRVSRPIGVGQVIYASDVAHIPTVRKGSIVTLLYEGKTVQLALQAEALADGAAGETILVRNMESRKDVYAVVRDSSTVVVVKNQ